MSSVFLLVWLTALSPRLNSKQKDSLFSPYLSVSCVNPSVRGHFWPRCDISTVWLDSFRASVCWNFNPSFNTGINKTWINACKCVCEPVEHQKLILPPRARPRNLSEPRSSSCSFLSPRRQSWEVTSMPGMIAQESDRQGNKSCFSFIISQMCEGATQGGDRQSQGKWEWLRRWQDKEEEQKNLNSSWLNLSEWLQRNSTRNQANWIKLHLSVIIILSLTQLWDNNNNIKKCTLSTKKTGFPALLLVTLGCVNTAVQQPVGRWCYGII